MIRLVTTDADRAALAGLRRRWTEEDTGGAVDDPAFEARFADWLAHAAGRRVAWLAAMGAEPVGMLNMAIFERMPRPAGRSAAGATSRTPTSRPSTAIAASAASCSRRRSRSRASSGSRASCEATRRARGRAPWTGEGRKGKRARPRAKRRGEHAAERRGRGKGGRVSARGRVRSDEITRSRPFYARAGFRPAESLFVLEL